MQQRLILRGILGAVILLIGMLGLVVFWLWTQSPLTLLQAQPPLPEILGLLPRSTAALIALDAPIDRLQDLIQTATPPDRRRLTRRLQARLLSPSGPGILGQLFTLGDLDFNREIQPWLGEEMIWAWVPLEADPHTEATEAAVSPPELGSLLVLSTRDTDRSLLFLNLLWQRQELAGRPLKISTYKGVQIVTVPLGEELDRDQDRDQAQLAGAAFTKDFLLFTDRPQVLQQAIDAWQMPQLSLRSTSAYQATLPTIQAPRLGWGLLQLQPPMATLSDAPDDQIRLQALGFSLRPNLRGVLSETQAIWDWPQSQPQPTAVPQRDPLVAHLPHTTLAFLSGERPDQLWPTLKILEPIGGVDLAKTLGGLELNTELNWQQDLFSWMDQGFALALLPSSSEHLEWFMVAEAEDSDGEALQQLDDRVRDLGLQIQSLPLSNPKWGEAIVWLPESYIPPEQQPQLPVEDPAEPAETEPEMAQTPISLSVRMAQAAEAEIPAEELEDPSDLPIKPPELPEVTPETPEPSPPQPLPVLAYHLQYQDHVYLTSSREALEKVLGGQPLAGSEVWQQATSLLPDRNQGYVFIKVEEALDWLSQILPEDSVQREWIQILQDSPWGWPETITLATTQIIPGLPSESEPVPPLTQKGELFIRIGS